MGRGWERDSEKGASKASQPGKAGMPGPAPPAGTPGPRSRRVDQERSTRCRRAGGHGCALTSVHEGIALDEARVFTGSRISSAVPTLNKFTPGHGYLIF